MKFATLADGSRDGRLLLVSRDLTRAVDAADIAPTLQAAVEHWWSVEADLRRRYDELNSGETSHERLLEWSQKVRTITEQVEKKTARWLELSEVV